MTQTTCAEVLQFVSENRGLVNAMVRASPSKLKTTFALLVDDRRCRMYLDFENKRSYFMGSLQEKHDQSPGLYADIHVRPRRTHILVDSFNALSDLPASSMFGPLNIEFEGEDGVDAGGVTREWFLLLFRQILNPNYGLFEFSADKSTYQPATVSEMIEEGLNLKYFKFAGRMIGKAIFEGHLVDAHFTRSFYKHMLGIPIQAEDMEAIDPQYYKSLRQILDHSMDDLSVP